MFPDFRRLLPSSVLCAAFSKLKAPLSRFFRGTLPGSCLWKPVGNFSQRRPITVAGPWPIFTAFQSHPEPAELSNRVYASLVRVSIDSHAANDSSSSGRAFRRVPANLPANPPAPQARSEKLSWSCSRPRATTVRGCPRSPSSPSSILARTAP